MKSEKENQLNAGSACVRRFVLRWRLLWWKVAPGLRYIWRTPSVFRSRYRLRKAGFVVRRTGGRLHAVYRIGEEDPISKCNRYGVPVAETILMGAAAMRRGYFKENVKGRATSGAEKKP